jgi:ribonuclease D
VTSDPNGTPDVTAARTAITLVDASDAVTAALAAVDLPVVGVDVERADADRYYRHAALVQVGGRIGGEEHCVLLDGMELDDLGALDRFLADRLTVLHAASNDVVPLAAKGVRPPRLVDTAIAAAVLGRPTGLDALLVETLDVGLSPDKERFQRADWSKRPLPEPMQHYAAGDVVFLPQLWAVLEADLAAARRTSWFEQELVASLDNAVTDTRDWRRVRGVGRLAPRQQSAVAAVWQLREEIARAHDIAPNLLLHDEVILAFAMEPPRTVAQLVRRARRRRRMEDEHAERFLAAMSDASQTEPPAPDPDRRRWTDRDSQAFDRMRDARAELATELGIDAGVLCPSKLLKDAVRMDPQDAQALCDAAALRPWQRELLAELLWDAYRGRGRYRGSSSDSSSTSSSTAPTS